MKISCSKETLGVGINIAMRAVPSKTTFPILESFLIDATNGIKIISNDNDMGIETCIAGNVEDPGKIAIDARLFSEIIRNLPESEVVIESDEKNRVLIYCEDSSFTLSGKDAAEFPEIPTTSEENRFTISQFSLKEIIRQTIFSIAVNDANALMKGELFEISGNKIKVTALDGHRIAIREEELAASYPSGKIIIPGKALNEISRVMAGEKTETVDIIYDKRFVKFVFDDTVVVSRLIEGEYFDVKRMISKDYSSVLKINRMDFLGCLNRSSILTRETEKKPVIIDIRKEETNISINSSLGSMDESISSDREGNDIVIGFNPKFLIEALKAVDDEIVSIFFVNSNAPCFIKNDEETYNYIILPVNINK